MPVTLSAVAFLVAAVWWTIGDMLVVGFAEPDADAERDFVDYMGSDMHLHQLGASETRLKWGALTLVLTVPVMLAGMWVHWVVADGSALAIAGLALLACGISLAPLAHAAFYYLGTTSQHAHQLWLRHKGGDAGVDRAAVDSARDVAVATRRILFWPWVPAVAGMVIGQFLWAVAVALGQTTLPWWAVFFTGPVWLVPCLLLPKLPYPGKPYLDGAAFNLAALIWAVALVVLVLAGYAG